MHAPLQTCCPGAQVHMPIVQAAPVEQAFPQLPQLVASVWVETQRPLHNEVPAGQAHALLVHDCPSAQLTPQAPQFEGLVRVSTH